MPTSLDHKSDGQSSGSIDRVRRRQGPEPVVGEERHFLRGPGQSGTDDPVGCSTMSSAPRTWHGAERRKDARTGGGPPRSGTPGWARGGKAASSVPVQSCNTGPAPPGARSMMSVSRGGCGQLPAHLFDPTNSPDTKCFWNAKNTIVVGIAAMSAPAATTFHWEV